MIRDIIEYYEYHKQPVKMLELIESDIRDEINNGGNSKIKIGYSLYIIKTQELYKYSSNASFTKIEDYTNTIFNLKYSTTRQYLRIGKAFSNNKYLFEKIGTSDVRSAYMLLYVDKALLNHEEQEVITALKHMSYREFQEFADPLTETKKEKPRTVKFSNSLKVYKDAMKKTFSYGRWPCALVFSSSEQSSEFCNYLSERWQDEFFYWSKKNDQQQEKEFATNKSEQEDHEEAA
ncbi:MAG: hypothetical protein GF317_20035 [Candidatus Lokiarchaeota archaeon]|nr:hypothetical protein [Candidatus Lokiarchaeota archaeon]